MKAIQVIKTMQEDSAATVYDTETGKLYYNEAKKFMRYRDKIASFSKNVIKMEFEENLGLVIYVR